MTLSMKGTKYWAARTQVLLAFWLPPRPPVPPLTMCHPRWHLLQEFRLLMASTSACYQLFREKQKAGHGEAVMFKGE